MSDLPELVGSITGISTLKRDLGYWPSFHDAEILEVCLSTGGNSELKIRPVLQENLSRIDQGIIIVFEIAEIESLNLSGFYSQNIIMELTISVANNCFRIDIDGSVGLSGQITAKQLSVKVLTE